MSNSGVDVSNLIASWNIFAHTYDRRLGGSTFAVAAHILSKVPALKENSLVLDSSCGTGAFTVKFQKRHTGAHIHAVDKSAGMIEIMQSLIKQHAWQEHITAEVMDAENLDFAENTFDLSVTNFGIFFYPDPVRGAKEIHRTLKPGCMAAVTSWREICFVPIFYQVQKIVQPFKHMVLQMLETWRNRDTLENVMRQGGFSELEISSQDVMIIQKDMDELVDSLAIHLQDIVGQQWSDSEKAQIKPGTAKVMEEQRKTFVVDLDNGKVGLRMTAWIALGTK
ncbi:hypothetical protein MMC25_006175 [Agyrium rufum]|nr:hypothetical protein [Agyrium rufum]